MQKIWILALYMGSCVHKSQTATDWCKLTCKGGEKNTMCLYKPQKNSRKCKNITSSMDQVKRKQILHLHNDYRNEMANGKIKDGWPRASNMRQMSWDFDLERLALRWAQQCSEEPPHDKCRRTPMFIYNGQNKGELWHTSKYMSANRSFEKWVDEIFLTTPEIMSIFKGGEWGHFTQVIWAMSYKLGCTEIHFEEERHDIPYRFSMITMCNYGPGGNYIGASVYEKGDPCSACPNGTRCKRDSLYPFLCAFELDSQETADIDLPPEYLAEATGSEQQELKKKLNRTKDEQKGEDGQEAEKERTVNVVYSTLNGTESHTEGRTGAEQKEQKKKLNKTEEKQEDEDAQEVEKEHTQTVVDSLPNRTKPQTSTETKPWPSAVTKLWPLRPQAHKSTVIISQPVRHRVFQHHNPSSRHPHNDEKVEKRKGQKKISCQNCSHAVRFYPFSLTMLIVLSVQILKSCQYICGHSMNLHIPNEPS